MMDMADGVIIGAAFTAFVKFMVADLINLFIGIFTVGIDFTNLFVIIGKGASLAAAQDSGTYVLFIMEVPNFSIVAVAVFRLDKSVNKTKG